jgi:hypothetical protein
MNRHQGTNSGLSSSVAASRFWLPRLVCGLLSLVLLTAAVVKAMDMELFVRQIRDYGIISNHTLLVLGAWAVVAMECTLGVGLLVGYRPRLILFLTALLFLAFIGATGWALVAGTAEDCGCFGVWLERSPGEAMVVNLILLAGVAWAWVRFGQTRPSMSRAKAWATGTACLIGMVLPMLFGFSVSRIHQPPSDPSELLLGSVEVRGLGETDLNRGSHLVIVMGTDCDHCQAAVPDLNLLADTPDLPSPVGLCINEESARVRFMEDFEPSFPIGQISVEAFWRLLADGDMPRVLLVHDGRIVQVWDETIPDADTVRALLSL